MRWEKQVRWTIAQHPRYLYGGNILSTGIDCSKFPQLTLTEAGAKDLQRLTADDIYHGKDGWKGRDVNEWEALSLDLAFFRWRHPKNIALELPKQLQLSKKVELNPKLSGKKSEPTKRIDHMGIILEGKSGLLELAHMSSTKGGVIVPFTGVFAKDCVGLRRLTIVDNE